MFTDSEIAKQFSGNKTKCSYIVKDHIFWNCSVKS